MEMHITSHTFKTDDWETIDTIWNSPFFYWKRSGMRVSPPVPLRSR